ncbi:ABC transporter ATP-binding protein [Salinibacter ruber]|uniref:ATP-binding cassette subfamily C protein n=1 Tax=Salinibacter ruber TaxID=146919 RepID=A0A9X2Q489_9BACT|nr:ABC transporter ATP-binding protein [Salinibacter ruber]MCS3661172.1 ATP-binding cassette subfamily C protein [Salinibacter ruber]MCS3710971.1 ATP-binding cassette subfamily C protein [Salinibacter ruber]
MEIIKTFFDLLTQRERRNLYLLFCAVLVMAGLEVVSVASIMPFLSVASDPATVHENPYLNWAFETFGFTNTNHFLIALGFAALTALIISNAFIIFTTWALNRYVWARNHSLSRRLLRSYLYRPYEYFITRNSAELGKNILEEVKEVASSMLRPALRGAAKLIVALFIVGFLFFVNPLVALVVAIILGLAYTIVYYLIRDRLDRTGRERVEYNEKRFQFVSESFGGIKQVKIRGKEEAFLRKYSPPSKHYARVQAHYRVLKRAPRYILEAVAFSGIILIAVYLIAVQNNIRQVIPILGLYAFAGYRLMPALQQAFKGIASARFNIAALKKIHQDLDHRIEGFSHMSSNGTETAMEPLTLNDRIVIENVSFTYPEAEKPAIRNLTLEIPAHSTVGFVGKTGSGKTTTVDLILGLLRPNKGIISVDDKRLRGDIIRRWQQSIGYVPQQIYLADDTVARNIAFGVPEKEIDMGRVRDAARRAHIYEFVRSELSDEWETVVGERGVKLSGGQRQRIGIARALYHRPSVLVFDEATSALDQETEASVMEAIYQLSGDHTMLMIAHRLSTVKRADNVVMLEQGRKVGEGKYEKLSRQHSKFRSMALS